MGIREFEVKQSLESKEAYVSIFQLGIMGGLNFIVLLLGNFLLLLELCSTLPLCIDSTGPFKPNITLTFCTSYNVTSCCDSAEDANLQNKFQAMNITDPSCAAIMTSLLCAKCDPFAAELFRINTGPTRFVPVLCNSTVSSNSTQSKQASNNFCAQVWGKCSNTSVVNSPFTASLQGQARQSRTSNSTKITEFWQSQSTFCSTFGGASLDDLVCFDGTPVTFNSSRTLSFPSGMCLEKISNGSYINMVAHPDGSSRAFFNTLQGQVWFTTLPVQGSGAMIQVEAKPFLDVSNFVYYDLGFGLKSIAPHPNFAQNGRFFVSYNCDKSQWAGCGGRCSCNSAVNCDPSKLPSVNGALPCQYQSVISEFTAIGTSTNISTATNVEPVEVRRILTMGLPFTTEHSGQILFGPDGYLYFMMGDGGGVGDPYNFAQNKQTLLGKIMRLDIDNIPSKYWHDAICGYGAAEISQLGLWGNYSIPADNPYIEDTTLLPEIWALGFRNPWKCSFDATRPAYFMCPDQAQDTYESIQLVTKDGNYGWHVYEGPYLYTPPKSPGGNTSVNSIKEIFPIMGYNFSSVNNNEGAGVVGGYFYRSTTDPCMYGSFLYADYYGEAFWTGIENPEGSGHFNQTLIPFTCASDSPMPCSFVSGLNPNTNQTSYPSLGYVASLGEDNNNDIYILATNGVYRIVSPSRCNYTCSIKESVTPPSPSPTSTPSQTSRPHKNVILLCSSLLLIFLGFI